MKRIILLIALCCSINTSAQYILADAFPSVTKFTFPVDMSVPNDGTNRFFVLEQSGKIHVFPKAGAANTRKVFLDISAVSSQGGGEVGLLGLAFHPNFKENRFLYINYTSSKSGSLTSYVSRFQVSASNPDTVLLASEKELFTVAQPFSNHNGGCLKFGPDGYLYLSFGDGGSGGDPQNRAQNRKEYLGKILRIDVNDTANGKKYGIPSTNPYANGTTGFKPEIFAYGLRNVWRFSFDAATAKIWAGDVGQGLWEEIDTIQNGKNYGWRIMEGNHCYNPSTGCDTTGLVLPLWEYEHANGNVSITGGFVYRGSTLPGLYGKYIYADYATGRVWALTTPESGTITNTLIIDKPNYGTGNSTISAFGEGEDNELYVVTYTAGKLFRINQKAAPLATPTLSSPLNNSMNIPLSVQLSWNAVPNATGYKILITSTDGFTSLERDVEVGAVTTLTLALQGNSEYYWRVAALGASTSLWSEVWKFSTITVKPYSPVLISPQNNATLDSVSNFVWHKTKRTTSYNIQWSDQASFSNIIGEGTQQQGDSTFYAPPNVKEVGKQYWWRVRGCNELGCGEWSDIWTYKIQNLGVDEELSQNIRVYPNPAKTEFTFDLGNIIHGSYSLTLSDITGNVLLSEKNLTDGKYRIDAKGYPAGSYFLRVEVGAKTYLQKVVIE